MRANDFRKFLDHRPFEPIRVLISSGQTVDIRHPEQAMVARSMFVFATGPRREVVEDFGWYNLIHVVKIVPLIALGRRRTRRKGSA